MSIETVHTSAIAVLGVEVSLFRGVAFLPSPPIPINLDKKELIKRTAFSRNQACPDDLVGLYPDINSPNRSGPVYVVVHHSCLQCSSVCVSATLPHTTLGCTHRLWARLIPGYPPIGGPGHRHGWMGGSSHTWPLRGSCAICRFEKWMCHLVWKACDRSG